MWYTVVDIRKKDTTNGSFSTNHPKLDRIRQWKLIKSPSHAAPGICGPETKNWSWYTFASSRHRKPGGENELPHRGSNRQLQVAWRHNLRKYLCQLHGNLWPSWHLTQLAPVAGRSPIPLGNFFRVHVSWSFLVYLQHCHTWWPVAVSTFSWGSHHSGCFLNKHDT